MESTTAQPATATSIQLIDGTSYHHKRLHNKTTIKLAADQLPDQLPVQQPAESDSEFFKRLLATPPATPPRPAAAPRPRVRLSQPPKAQTPTQPHTRETTHTTKPEPDGPTA